jgi:deoxycytidylate deaminase
MLNTKRLSKMANIAYDQAILSPCRYKHGAVISKGSKVISLGFNNPRSKYLNYNDGCSHAEMDVATRFINGFYRKKKSYCNCKKNSDKLNNYIIWVVRISNPNSEHLESEITGSKPCSECVKKLLYLGFQKIGYSDNHGNIIVENLNNIKTDHQSNAQKYFSSL